MAAENVFNIRPVKRKLKNWIDGWMLYTEELPSPQLWRQWGGIALIAGVLERKVWTKTGIGALFPNLYTVIVGPPGVGKTVISSEVWEMWNELRDPSGNGLHIASSSITGATLIDELQEATRRVVPANMGDPLEFHALAVCSNELGVLLPDSAYEATFMNKLQDIYDGKPYSESRRAANIKRNIPKPIINLLACTTPAYLQGFMPDAAWDQGFVSRTFLVFSTEAKRRPIFSITARPDNLRADLVSDLKQIFSMTGELHWTPDAITAVETWAKAGAPPVPEHPKLMHYNTRRIAHVLKLSMVASISETDAMLVDISHFHTALNWLTEMEAYMSEIFKTMGGGGDRAAIEDCWYFVLQVYSKEQKPVHEERIVEYLAQRVPAFTVSRIIEVMIKGGLLIDASANMPAGNWYRPKAKKTPGIV